MTNADHRSPELLRHLSHDYLVYEVTDHAEHAPSSIGVSLERLGNPKFSIYCTGNFVDGKLSQVHLPSTEQAESDEELAMILLVEGSPELQSFVRNWIEYCFSRHGGAPDGTEIV
jgi:hypothetical protein